MSAAERGAVADGHARGGGFARPGRGEHSHEGRAGALARAGGGGAGRDAAGGGGRLPPLAVLGLLIGPLLSMIDSSVVNVALPEIASALGTTLSTTQWVASVYLLALSATVPATAWAARRFGTLRVYLASIMGFTLASAGCALAPGAGALIAARALQGVAGAPLVPLAMNLLLPRDGAGKDMPASAGVMLFLAPAVGPVLGGLLVRAGGWPAIFLVNVPLGVLGAVAVAGMVRRAAERPDPSVRLDPVGLLLLAVGLGLAAYGSASGPLHGWWAAAVWPCWAGGLALLLAYGLWAARRPHPALNLRLLRLWATALPLALSVLTEVVMYALVVLVPVFMETVQGATPLTAGLTLLPQGVVTGVGTVLGNTLAARKGVRFSAVAGLAGLTAGTLLMLAVGVGTPAWAIALLLCTRGLATGLVIQPLLMATIGELPPAEVADGNTLFNVAQRLAGGYGIALILTYLQARERVHVAAAAVAGGGAGPLRAAAAQAFQDTTWVLVGLAVAGLAAALWVRQAGSGTAAQGAAEHAGMEETAAAGSR